LKKLVAIRINIVNHIAIKIIYNILPFSINFFDRLPKVSIDPIQNSS